MRTSATLLALAAAAQCAASTHAACAVDSGSFSAAEALMLDASIDFQLQYTVGGGQVTLALSSNHTGYMGIGLGEPTSGHMVGADVVTARIVGGVPDVDDRYVPWQAFPFASNVPGVADRSTAPFFFYEDGVNVSVTPSLFPELDADGSGCEDWEVVSSQQSGSCQQIVMRRALVTNDDNDRAFIPGTAQPVLWAWGETTALDFHDGNRGSLAVDFGSAASTQGNFAEPPCGSPGCAVVELDMGGYAIPAQETTYACRSFDLDDYISGDHHGIAIYPVIDNTKYVHHILVHRCNVGEGSYIPSHVTTQTCGGGTTGGSPLTAQCESLLFGWAVGMGPLVLPAAAGFRMSNSAPSGASDAATRFIVLEVHYDNPAGDVGQTDSTSMRIHVTSNLRPNDAGTLGLGDPFTRMQSLPSGQATIHRQGVCEKHCTEEAIGVGQSLTLFSVFNHMHSFGHRMWTNQYGSGGAFKRTIAPIDAWSFGNQRGFPIDITMERGDEFFVHCQYDTRKWPENVGFGQDSLEEMCMVFVSYYPVVLVDSAPFTSCGGAFSLEEAIPVLQSIAPVPVTAPTVLGLLNNPKVERMYGGICSAASGFMGGNMETTTSFNIQYPVQPVDPRVYVSAGNSWARDESFGTGATGVCGAAPTEPPTPATGGSASDDPNFDFKVRAVGDMDLYWRVQADCSVSLRLSVPGDRWVAFGFGTRMTNGKVVIAQDAASVGEFSISLRSELGVGAHSGASGIVGTPEWTLEAGVRTLRVNMTTIAGDAFTHGCEAPGARRRNLAAAPVQSVIVAYGTGLDLDTHAAERVLSLNWDSGVAGALAEGGAALNAHAFVMSLVFGLCLPVVALFPATKRPESKWFMLHRGAAGLALLGLVGGIVAGVVHVADQGGAHFSKPHHFVGLLAALLVLANPVLGALRPGKEAASRKQWLMAHRVVGYGAMVVGLVNIVLGARLVEDNEAYGGENSVVVGAVFVAIGALLLTVAGVAAAKQNKTAPVGAVKTMDL